MGFFRFFGFEPLCNTPARFHLLICSTQARFQHGTCGVPNQRNFAPYPAGLAGAMAGSMGPPGAPGPPLMAGMGLLQLLQVPEAPRRMSRGQAIERPHQARYRQSMGPWGLSRGPSLSSLILAGDPNGRDIGKSDTEEVNDSAEEEGEGEQHSFQPQADLFASQPDLPEGNPLELHGRLPGGFLPDDSFPPQPGAWNWGQHPHPGEVATPQAGGGWNLPSRALSRLNNWMASPAKLKKQKETGPKRKAAVGEEHKENDRRPGLPGTKGRENQSKKERMDKAVLAARCLRARGLKRPSIEASFSAVSSRDSKNSKRKTVAKFLEELKGDLNYMPLSPDLLKGLASVLQEAGYQAGEGYLVEAKLWHVEEGFPWSDQLDRIFKQCKRALARGQGPRKKALEVTRAMRDNPNTAYFLKSKEATKFTKDLFLFSMVWMLREIELANVSTEDIQVDYGARRVALLITVSKTDPSAKGVTRTLQCLCEGADHAKSLGDCSGCESECPFAVSTGLLFKVQKFNGTVSQVALMRDKSPATKSQVISSWQLMFGKGVTGHSGRRTGALHYIRSGYSISQTAYLGRWKSNAILSYAEEALEQLPANLKVESPTVKEGGEIVREKRTWNEEEHKAWREQLKAELTQLKNKVKNQQEEADKFQSFWNSVMKENQTALPKKVQSISGKVIHWNLTGPSTSPPVSWKTACGWYFYGSNFTFVDQGAADLLEVQRALRKAMR